jgi:hypothetical protein
MWKEGQIVTVSGRRYEIVKRKSDTGTICDECQEANKDAQLLLSWYERHHCTLNGTMCHCNMEKDCYPKLLD